MKSVSQKMEGNFKLKFHDISYYLGRNNRILHNKKVDFEIQNLNAISDEFCCNELNMIMGMTFMS